MTAIELNSVVNVPTQPVRFLIIDDDHVSVLAIKRALKKLKIINPVQVARDGREALEMLRGEFGDGHRLPPYLVTLDLNMPRMNGIEFLQEIRKDPELADTVVFILTTSDDERDKLSAYDNHVAGYIVKSNDTGQSCVDTLKMLDHAWRVVDLPAA